MTLFTPTQTGSFLAGIGLNSLVWGIIWKLDSLVELLGLKMKVKERFLDWVANHKIVAFLIGEIMNLSVHGVTQPESVLFATGGTIVNTFMVLVFIPLRQLRKRLLPG